MSSPSRARNPVAQLSSKLGEVRVKSVMNAPLWVNLMLVIAVLISAWAPQGGKIMVFLEWICGASIGFTMLAYAYWSFRDAERLQSEPHRALMYRYTQQGRSPATIDVTPMPNPELPPAMRGDDITPAFPSAPNQQHQAGES